MHAVYCISLCIGALLAHARDGGLSARVIGASRWEMHAIDSLADGHPLHVAADTTTNAVIVATRSEIAIADALGSANWSRIYSPSATINRLEVFDSVIYLSTDEGLFTSRDRETWFRVWADPTSDVYARGTDIYVGTAHGLLISRDGGGSWTTSLEGVINAIFVLNRNTTREIIVAMNSSIARSIDDGITWAFYRSDANMSAIVDVALVRESIFATTARGLLIGQLRDPAEPAWTREFDGIALRTITCTPQRGIMITSTTGLREWNGTFWRTYTTADGLGGDDTRDFAMDANATMIAAIYAFAPMTGSSRTQSSSSSRARATNWAMLGAGMGIICVGLSLMIAGVFGCIRPCMSSVRREEFEGLVVRGDDRSMSLQIRPRFLYTFMPCRIRAFVAIITGVGLACGGATLIAIGARTKFEYLHANIHPIQ